MRIQFAMPDALDLACYVSRRARIGSGSAAYRRRISEARTLTVAMNSGLREYRVNMGEAGGRFQKISRCRTDVDDLKALMAILDFRPIVRYQHRPSVKVFGIRSRQETDARQGKCRKAACKNDSGHGVVHFPRYFAWW